MCTNILETISALIQTAYSPLSTIIGNWERKKPLKKKKTKQKNSSRLTVKLKKRHNIAKSTRKKKKRKSSETRCLCVASNTARPKCDRETIIIIISYCTYGTVCPTSRHDNENKQTNERRQRTTIKKNTTTCAGERNVSWKRIIKSTVVLLARAGRPLASPSAAAA